MARRMISKSPMSESRTHRRTECKMWLLGAANTTFSGQVQDLSASGLCLATTTELKQGRQLHLEFTLAGEVVEVVGEVRWVRDGQVGIRFVRISAHAQELIAEATREVPVESRWMRRNQFVALSLVGQG